MNTRIRCAAYSLVVISIVLTLLLAYPDVSKSRAKARALAPTSSLNQPTVGMLDEDSPPVTVTLTPALEGLRTWSTLSRWANDRWNCKEIGINALTGIGDYLIAPEGPSPPPGQIGVGYIDHWDAGGGPLPCEEQFKAEYRGTIWFDLSEILSKPSFAHADKATLKFKRIQNAVNDNNGHKTIDKVCNDHLAAANLSWWKEGRDPNTFIPEGDYIPPSLSECPYEGCSIDVKDLVNNWITGKVDRNGFVIVGQDTKYVYGLYPRDNAACETYYGDFSLTVTYRFPIKKSLTTPQTYPLVCRGTETLNVHDLDGPVPYRWVGFTFTPGSKPAGEGLLPGQCSWQDRGMRAGEPARLAQPIEGALAWIKDLNSSNSYWTFNVYNAGDQMQATGAERNKRIFLPLLRTNVALASNRATANARSFTADGVVPGLFFEPAFAIDGVLHTTSAGGNYWRDEGLPSWLEVVFDGVKTIDEIDVITIQVPGYDTGADPSESDPKSFSSQGAENFEVQYLNGSTWDRVPNGLIIGNSAAFRKITFPPAMKTITTSKIRVYVSKSSDGVARIVELEAWGH